MTDKVLSLSLRPQNLDEIIGQDDVIEIVKTQLNSGRVPHFFLITGFSGTGKTTLARIIAVMLQYKDPKKVDYSHPLSRYDIKEINGSDKNGVDDIREILDTINYKPLAPSLSKVIIIDEAHQLTTQAQNALLKVTEDSPSTTYFIFCTSVETKILLTLRRRAYILHTHGIDKLSTHKLLLTAKKKIGFKKDTDEFEEALVENGINSPGLILQAAEKFFNGSSINDSIFNCNEGAFDSKLICNLVSKGNWKELSPILKTVLKEDVVMLRNMILGYLKTILLSSGSIKIAQAIKIIAEEVYDLPTFLANIAIACDVLQKTS
jgi:DNA polymerase-3 subunit gamma/tau